MSQLTRFFAAFALATSSAAVAAESMECCKSMKECCCKKEDAAASLEKKEHSEVDHSKMNHGTSKPNPPKR